MGKVLSRIELDITYLDDVFRSKEFFAIDDFKSCEWFTIAEAMESYTDNPNMRIIHIKSSSDYKLSPEQMNDNKYSIIQEMIASFDDEATLIFTNDNSIFEDNYAAIGMYPIADNKNILTYVYENAAGVYLLDKMQSTTNKME